MQFLYLAVPHRDQRVPGRFAAGVGPGTASDGERDTNADSESNGTPVSAGTSGVRDEALPGIKAARDWRCPGHHGRDGEEFAVSGDAEIAAGTWRAAMSEREFKMNCSEVGPLLVFLACDELTVNERAA